MKRLVILGSTGSIGRQALEVALWRGYRVVGLAAGKNLEVLAEQIARFRPLLVAAEAGLHRELKARFPWLKLASAEEVAAMEAEVAVAAIPGLAGLPPPGWRCGRASGWPWPTRRPWWRRGPSCGRRWKGRGRDPPVDSEHSALFQALLGESKEEVAELILTASGGPS